MSSEHRVRTDNGKYEFIERSGKVEILRRGERWVDDVHGAGAIRSLMMGLDAARVVVAAVQRTIDLHLAGLAPVYDLRRALEQHDQLVGGDRTPPSDWCGTTQPASVPDRVATPGPGTATPDQASPAESGDATHRYWRDGTRLVEECMARARRADRGDAPVQLSSDEALLWHAAQAAAYHHALEMIGWTGGTSTVAPDDDLGREIEMMETEGYVGPRWQRGLAWLRELRQLRAARAAGARAGASVGRDRATLRAFMKMPNAATLEDLNDMRAEVDDARLGPADRAEVSRVYEQRRAWLQTRGEHVEPAPEAPTSSAAGDATPRAAGPTSEGATS